MTSKMTTKIWEVFARFEVKRANFSPLILSLALPLIKGHEANNIFSTKTRRKNSDWTKKVE